MEETAISWADVADVTAMNIMMRVQMAPDFPNKPTAAYGSTKPADTSAGSMRFGYVGNAGFVSRARALRPMVVAHSQGIANQDKPPMIYPGSADTG